MRALVAATVGLLLVLTAATPAPAAVSLPPGFQDSLVTRVDVPTALAFTPDGRLLVASQFGTVHVYANGQLGTALDLSGAACTNAERGVLGVAVDPAFAANHYVYLFYTRKTGGDCPVNSHGVAARPGSPVNRVSRFVLGGDGKVAKSSETVLIDNIPSPGGNHNGGDLQFGPDGHLYVTTGDGDCDWLGDSGCQELNDAARDQHVLLGKVLRITASGGIPAGNPFQGADADRCNVAGQTTAGRRCRETYAWGLRNPYRIAFDPNTSLPRFFINDVGQHTWEEIDDGQAGADYGWSLREGFCENSSSTDCGPPPPGITNPIYAYGRSGGCKSVTAAAFVRNGAWPGYNGAYLYSDFVCGKLFTLTPGTGGSYTSKTFATNTGGIVAMRFGPHGAGQALYYLDYDYSFQGEVRRIVHTGAANRPPHAVAAANPTSGLLPLTVQFDGGQSSDPDGDALTYTWDFGDGSASATGKTLTHTYTKAKAYTAKLTVRDPKGSSDSAQLRIDAGNRAPSPTILSPASSKRFRVGEQLTLTGSATDPEDGPLPKAALSWRVERQHGGDHVHPYLPPTPGNDVPLTTPAPEDVPSTTTSYLQLYLTATDSKGLSTTVKRNLHPRLVDVTFATDPAGLHLDVAGETIEAPLTVTSWHGWQLGVSAYDQAAAGGDVWSFERWSDGGASTHTITTPDAGTTYTAAFKRGSAPLAAGAGSTPASRPSSRLRLGGRGRDRIFGTDGPDRVCGRGGSDLISLAGGSDVGYGGECGAAVASRRRTSAGGRDGNDVLRGGAGRDRLYGNGGGDFLNGGAGADSLNGGSGADRLIGGGAVDSFRGGPGNDVIVARDGRREHVDCGSGHDRVIADRFDVLRRC